MSILDFIPANEFYTDVSAREIIHGQLCWVVVPHIDPVPRILDVERSDPRGHEEVKFTLRNANRSSDFRRSDRTLPLKNLDLRTSEELLTQRAKKRPGIVLTSGMDEDPELARLLRRKGKSHLHGPSRFVVPCYRVLQDQYGTGVPQEMARRVQCLIYRQYFYCPGHGDLIESIARFDRLQVVVGSDVTAITPMPLALSEPASELFRDMFLYCITGEESEELGIIRQLLREALPPSCIPQAPRATPH